MKKPVSRILSILSSMAVAFVIAACGGPEPEPTPTPTPTPTPDPTPKTVAVTGVSLNKTTLTLTEGGSETLTATVSPGDATNKNVNWTSSDASVASVDGNGKVTAVKPGTVSVIVSTADGGKTATCSITVEAKKIPVTGVKLDKDTAELVEGEELTLTATVAPEDATDKTIEWSTSSAEVATVEDGKVTAVAPGTATITVKTKDGEKTATCEVTVIAKTIPVEGVTIDIETEVLELTEGGETTISVTVTPEDASDKSVEWSSSDESVVTVDAEGKVTAVAPGTATITVKTKDGEKTATCEVTVAAKVIPVEAITFTKEAVSVIEGETVLLYVSFTPKNPTNKKVTWKSSDTSVATVDTKGNVTGVKAGTAQVTVTTIDGGKTSTCTVTVTKKPVSVEKVTLNRTALTLVVDSEAILVATVSPNDATNKNVTWSSSKETVVTVDENGELKAKKVGTATITVTTEDGGKTATCEVTVTNEQVNATGVKISPTSLTVGMGKTAQLTATVSPSNATDHSVTWSSSNESVAKVDKTGKVTPVKPGTVTITAKTKNNKSATCSVKVVQYVESINITGASGTVIETLTRTVWYGGSYPSTSQLYASVSPSNATNKSVQWSSSNTGVAKIDQNGKVTFVKPGTITITATAKDGSGVKKSITYIIYEGVADKITLTSSGGTGNFQTRVNGTFTVTAKLSCNDRWTPLVNEVTWSLSSNSNAQIVSYTATTCTIKGISATSASYPVILTAKAKSGNAQASQQIGILNPPYITSINLPSTLTLTAGTTQEVKPGITPANGDLMELIWTDDNTSVATISRSNSGSLLITGKKAGTATISCKAPGTGATSQITVKVTKQNPVTGINFNNYPTSTSSDPIGSGYHYVKVSVGGTTTVTANISPSSADLSDVVWVIPNNNVAKIVSYSGRTCKIQGVAKGNIQLTCRDTDSGKAAMLAIMVQ